MGCELISLSKMNMKKEGRCRFRLVFQDAGRSCQTRLSAHVQRESSISLFLFLRSSLALFLRILFKLQVLMSVVLRSRVPGSSSFFAPRRRVSLTLSFPPSLLAPCALSSFCLRLSRGLTGRSTNLLARSDELSLQCRLCSRFRFARPSFSLRTRRI